MKRRQAFALPEHDPWEDQGLCRKLDPAEAEKIFFPYHEQKFEVTRAREICSECPVFYQCLDLADSIPSSWPGIFAGLSRQDRLSRRGIRSGRGRNVAYLPRWKHGDESMRQEAQRRGVHIRVVIRERKQRNAG